MYFTLCISDTLKIVKTFFMYFTFPDNFNLYASEYTGDCPIVILYTVRQTAERVIGV